MSPLIKMIKTVGYNEHKAITTSFRLKELWPWLTDVTAVRGGVRQVTPKRQQGQKHQQEPRTHPLYRPLLHAETHTHTNIYQDMSYTLIRKALTRMYASEVDLILQLYLNVIVLSLNVFWYPAEWKKIIKHFLSDLGADCILSVNLDEAWLSSLLLPLYFSYSLHLMRLSFYLQEWRNANRFTHFIWGEKKSRLFIYNVLTFEKAVNANSMQCVCTLKGTVYQKMNTVPGFLKSWVSIFDVFYKMEKHSTF